MLSAIADLTHRISNGSHSIDCPIQVSASQISFIQFSKAFLDALSKLDGAIFVVADPPQAALTRGKNPPWFSPSQPHLIADMVWRLAATLAQALTAMFTTKLNSDLIV